MAEATRWNYHFRKYYNANNRVRLKNTDITLISSDCTGGVMLHDLGLAFNSPFVNLWIRPAEYVSMLSNLPWYMQQEVEFIKEDGVGYPVGLLGGNVRLYFQHYATEAEAKEKWDERKRRMDYEHLYVIFTDRNGCTMEDLRKFDALPYSHKAVLVHTPAPEIASAVYIRGFEDAECVGITLEFRNRFSPKRVFDDFDYVGWFNQQQ